jgi:hypothetical protein
MLVKNIQIITKVFQERKMALGARASVNEGHFTLTIASSSYVNRSRFTAKHFIE